MSLTIGYNYWNFYWPLVKMFKSIILLPLNKHYHSLAISTFKKVTNIFDYGNNTKKNIEYP
jgi:hypothetical protein